MTKAQASVFSVVLAAGVATTWFTFQHLKKETETIDPDNPDSSMTGDPATDPGSDPATTDPATAGTGGAGATGDPAGTLATAPDPEAARAALFSQPEKVMGALADLVKAKDAAGFIALAGEDAIAPEDRPALIELLESPDYAPDTENPVLPLARLEDRTRWAIQLKPVATPAATEAAATALPDRQIHVDLTQPERQRWEIAQVMLPAPYSPGMTDALSPDADPITVAYHFTQATMSGDFKTARALSDPDKITDERIAALMIAIEDGEFGLQKDRPLTQTLSRDTVSWIIARVENEAGVSEFGLEMSKLDPAVGWRIDNMSFDKMIQMTAAAAGAGDVAYAPIVKNPQGGDSLVLFFDFDDAGLSPRALKQVEIIADILKENPAREININGHADALGNDDYNNALSAQRAAAVREALIDFGVAQTQIITKGFGEAAPVSPNFKPDGSDNPSGRSKNRRTEVYLNF